MRYIAMTWTTFAVLALGAVSAPVPAAAMTKAEATKECRAMIYTRSRGDDRGDRAGRLQACVAEKTKK